MEWLKHTSGKKGRHQDARGMAAQVATDAFSDEELLNFYLELPEGEREKIFADTERAARIVGLSRRTIQLWVETGLVRAVAIGRKYQVSLDSLKEYLRSRSRKPH